MGIMAESDPDFSDPRQVAKATLASLQRIENQLNRIAELNKDTKMAIEQFIDNEVKNNDVVLFMKGTPQFPQCGFSGQVVQILDYLGVPYKGLNVLESDDLRNGIKTYSSWPTIPQLYVKGEFVGGADIIREMFQAGELQTLLQDKGVAAAA